MDIKDLLTGQADNDALEAVYKERQLIREVTNASNNSDKFWAKYRLSQFQDDNIGLLEFGYHLEASHSISKSELLVDYCQKCGQELGSSECCKNR